MGLSQSEFMVYGIIGLDITAQQVATWLASVGDSADVTVRINSRGGNVFEGVAILNALRGHGGQVTTVVDGIAASAASFIAMGGNEVVMNRNSEMMIHNGSIEASGGMEDLRKMADNLERINTNMASIYADKAGGTTEDWLAVMAYETWYSAEEAVKAGLADRVEAAASQDGAAIAASIDLSAFEYAGRQSAPAPRIPQAHNQTPQPVEAEVNRGEEGVMPTLNEGLAERLGITADADDETILNALDEALAERADDNATTGVAATAPTLDQATQVLASAGMAVVDRDQYAATVQAAQAGAQARAEQLRERDERLVAAAINDGRIPPARRDHHLQALAVDREGHTAVLAALQPGLVPLAEMGHGGTSEITNEDDAVYASLYGKDA